MQLLPGAVDELLQARYLMGSFSNADTNGNVDLTLAGIDLMWLIA